MNVQDLILPVRTRAQYRSYLSQQNAMQLNVETTQIQNNVTGTTNNNETEEIENEQQSTNISSLNSTSSGSVHVFISQSLENAIQQSSISPEASAIDDGAETFKCSICLEMCTEKEPTATACGHVFCGTCIAVFFAMNSYVRNICPNCKAPASPLLRIFP